MPDTELAELVVDGTALQRSGRLFVSWDRKAPRRGILVLADACPDPECPCRKVDVQLREVGEGLQRVSSKEGALEIYPAEAVTPATAPVWASFDLESGWVEVEAGPGPSAEIQDPSDLRERFQALCDQRLMPDLQALWMEAKGWPKRMAWERADWTFLEEGQTLLAWCEVSPGNPDFLQVGGQHYAVVESYCAMARCPCNEVAVDVLRLDGDPAIKVSRGQVSVGGFRIKLDTMEVHSLDPAVEVGRSVLQAVASAYLARYPGLERARRRKRRMGEVGPRILKLADEQTFGPHVEPVRVGPKIAPNDRCPCGSGKKYKRCCGASKGA